MAHTEKPIKATSIPRIHELRSKLGYENKKELQYRTFADDTKSFQRKFQTSSGIKATDLLNWKSPQHQAGLDEMTTVWLDDCRNGTIFWPEDDTSSFRNRLVYTRDSDYIRNLVKQLFYQIGQDFSRNQKYHTGKKHLAHDARTESPFDANAAGGNSIDTTASPSASTCAPSDVQLQFTGLDFPTTGQTDHDPANNDPHLDYEYPDPSNISINDVPIPFITEMASPEMLPAETINQTGTKRPFHEDGTTQLRNKPKPQQTPIAPTGKDAASTGKRFPTRQRSNRNPNLADLADLDGIPLHNTLASQRISSQKKRRLNRAKPTFAKESVRTSVESSDDTTIEVGHSENQSNSTEPLRHTQHSVDGDRTTKNETAISSDTPVDEKLIIGPFKVPVSVEEPPMLVDRPGTTRPDLVDRAHSHRAKPSVNFVYRVVLPRTPRPIMTRWSPRGRLQDKTLSQLLTELPFEADVPGLSFTIKGVDVDTVENIPRDDEDGFESMKRFINDEIMRFIRQRRQAIGRDAMTGLVIDIIIKRLGDDSDVNLGKVEDLDFEDFELAW